MSNGGSVAVVVRECICSDQHALHMYRAHAHTQHSRRSSVALPTHQLPDACNNISNQVPCEEFQVELAWVWSNARLAMESAFAPPPIRLSAHLHRMRHPT